MTSPTTSFAASSRTVFDKGICVVGLYIAYVIPVFLRLRNPDLQPGPWNLGKWSKPVGWIAVFWVAFITILFFCPLLYPWNVLNNFNFTGPLIFSVFLLFGAWYWLSARRWFTGPKVQGTPEEVAAIEHELGEIPG